MSGAQIPITVVCKWLQLFILVIYICDVQIHVVHSLAFKAKGNDKGL